jgi:hypothetical protein
MRQRRQPGLQLQRGLGIMINSVEGAEGISLSTTGYSNAFLTLVAQNLICNFSLFHNSLFAYFQRQIYLEVRGGFGCDQLQLADLYLKQISNKIWQLLFATICLTDDVIHLRCLPTSLQRRPISAA